MNSNIWRKQFVKEELMLSTSMTDHGALAYHRLIMHYRDRDGLVRDDDRKLARVVAYPLQRWRKVRPELLEHFEIVDGYWRHAEEDGAIAEAKRKSKARSHAGKRGADARWTPAVVTLDGEKND